MAHLREHSDLRVYRVAVAEATTLFELTAVFPREERYALTDQMRRSSRAVGALIAEAWGRRLYPAAFVNVLSQAVAETNETRAWLDHARQCGYISEENYAELDAAWSRISGMLYMMQQKARKFAGRGSR